MSRGLTELLCLQRTREFGCVGGGGQSSPEPIRSAQGWEAQPEGSTQEEGNVCPRALARAEGSCALPAEGDSREGEGQWTLAANRGCGPLEVWFAG